jgi:hypothetical protein
VLFSRGGRVKPIGIQVSAGQSLILPPKDEGGALSPAAPVF